MTAIEALIESMDNLSVEQLTEVACNAELTGDDFMVEVALGMAGVKAEARMRLALLTGMLGNTDPFTQA